MRIIKTNRLVLRPICKEDRDAMVNTVMSDMTVMKWLPGAKDTVTPGGQKAVASAYLKDFTTPWKTHGFGIWALCIKDPTLGTPGTFIGYCGFLPEQIQDAGPEVAYALGKAMWGKGLVTEALAACLDWIFTKPEFSRIHAVTDTGNTASRRVMEKTGMTHQDDVDLYDSVAKGEGLLPFYAIDRNTYKSLCKRPDLV